uniref:CAF1C_H4-bd domain-containing protein n=1 Tax=Steinernema glaseri TaxID=37863 RepID=A0A1I8AVJ0_9BILA
MEVANFEKLERAASESHQTTSSADSGLFSDSDSSNEQLFGRIDDENDAEPSRSFERKVEHLIPRPERYLELFNGLPTFSWDLCHASPKADH